MVHGLDKFKSHFYRYSDCYVFIGGVACSILLTELGFPFRTTKDFDIILIMEAIDAEFGETFWEFIKKGGYSNRRKSSTKEQFYRFENPLDKSYPKIIELFSRNNVKIDLPKHSLLTPIHIDESITSLSAILLNNTYYELMISEKILIGDLPVLSIEAIILFKIKAYLDISFRYQKGDKVDSKDVRKHKNDIFRLLAVSNPSMKVKVDLLVKEDIEIFKDVIQKDKPDLWNLGIKRSSFDELVGILNEKYY